MIARDESPCPSPSEPVPALEVFVSGLDRIEPVGGGCYRFVLYSGKEDRMVVLRVVAPLEAFPDAIGKMLRCLGQQVFVDAQGVVRKLM